MTADAVDPRQIDADVAGCAAAHQRLLEDLDRLLSGAAALPDDPVGRPSRLEGWTIGHVLTHLARNADALAGMIAAADRGEVADQYPGGWEQRDGDIEQGATRPLADQIADVRRSIWELEATWTRATAAAWSGRGRALLGEVPISHLPFRRWREVEIHHLDLGLPDLGLEGVGLLDGPADWSPDWVRSELSRQVATWKSRRPMGMTDLPSEALALAPTDRLAWLVGRLTIPGVPDAGLMA